MHTSVVGDRFPHLNNRKYRPTIDDRRGGVILGGTKIGYHHDWLIYLFIDWLIDRLSLRYKSISRILIAKNNDVGEWGKVLGGDYETRETDLSDPTLVLRTPPI